MLLSSLATTPTSEGHVIAQLLLLMFCLERQCLKRSPYGKGGETGSALSPFIDLSNESQKVIRPPQASPALPGGKQFMASITKLCPTWKQTTLHAEQIKLIPKYEITFECVDPHNIYVF